MNKIKDIQLADIIVTRSNIENVLELDIQPGVINFSYEFDFGVSRINNACRVVFDCFIEARKNNGDIVGIKGDFEIVYLFRLPDACFSDEAEKKMSNMLDIDIALAMANLAYSTSRGIIYTRCEAIGIRRAILPILYTIDLERILRQHD